MPNIILVLSVSVNVAWNNWPF